MYLAKQNKNDPLVILYNRTLPFLAYITVTILNKCTLKLRMQ